MAKKVAVSERAVLQRVNRKLAAEGRNLRTARLEFDGTAYRLENRNLGRHYIIDIRQNVLLHAHVDLEGLAKKLGALRPWEELEDEG